jgi:hypothetical protein
MSALGGTMTAAERQTAGRIVGAWITKTKADEFALTMKPVLFELEIEGITGRTEVANALNVRGYPSPGEKQWAATTVTNLVGRIAVMKVMA